MDSTVPRALILRQRDGLNMEKERRIVTAGKVRNLHLKEVWEMIIFIPF